MLYLASFIIIILSFMIFYYRDKSNKDLSTKCYNKDWFMGRKNSKLVRMMKAVQKDSRKTFGLMIVDMDNFKQYNDKEGHVAGDKLIISTVKSIKESIRSYDIMARVGGDELAIVLKSNKSMPELENKIKKIKKNIQLKTNRTVSIGGVCYIRDMPLSVDFVISKADKNMYKDKENARRRLESA